MVQFAGLSTKVATVATAVACIAASTAAIGLRGNVRFKGTASAVIYLPITVPIIVLGLADYIFFIRYRLTGSWLTIALAHSFLVTPYVFVTMSTSLSSLDPALIRSARSLGAGFTAVARHVYWPAIRPGLFAGAIFAFVQSFDEVVIALFLQRPGVTTLPVQMYTSLQLEFSPKIAAVATLLILLTTLALGAQALFWRDRRLRDGNAMREPANARGMSAL